MPSLLEFNSKRRTSSQPACRPARVVAWINSSLLPQHRIPHCQSASISRMQWRHVCLSKWSGLIHRQHAQSTDSIERFSNHWLCWRLPRTCDGVCSHTAYWVATDLFKNPSVAQASALKGICPKNSRKSSSKISIAWLHPRCFSKEDPLRSTGRRTGDVRCSASHQSTET